MSAEAEPGGAARREAPATVAFGIADFLARTEVERFALFRRHLAATVRRVSPLLPELALLEGINLSATVALIQPPRDWPWRDVPDFTQARVLRAQERGVWIRSGRPGSGPRLRRAFVEPGLVLRDVDHPRGPFAIRPCGDVLGVVAGLGPCTLSAFGRSPMLKLPQQLPETLVHALPGRPLGAVVDHPLFAAADYRILRVSRDAMDSLPILVFRAPLVDFAMPACDGVPVARTVF